jgi:hypothetical protein
MRLESQEEYEAALDGLDRTLNSVYDYGESPEGIYFQQILKEAIEDWKLVTKATPHIDAFYEAIDAEPVRRDIATRQLYLMEKVLGLGHRECVKARLAHGFSEPHIYIDPNESMLGLVSQLSTDLISCLELGISPASTVTKLASLTVYIDSCREGKSDGMLDGMYSTAVTLIGTVPKLH